MNRLSSASDQNRKAIVLKSELPPAGSPENMDFAFAYGADAVYAGQPCYSLRVRNNQFKSLDIL